MDGMNPSSNDTPGINLPPPAAPAATSPAVPSATPPTGDTSTTQPAKPPVSGDDDEIEKEWVNKVKEIVGRTRDDPYRQNVELTTLKADYMKQRYDKIIKVDK